MIIPLQNDGECITLKTLNRGVKTIIFFPQALAMKGEVHHKRLPR